ncbi:hypothetical protein D4764_16G0003110 [Takifugu flavidus]|uniref:Uncharacterized protein n=1 Tax=Takifugu flavidus TaxID=433684 RepID=A0A5C6NWG2_9TELE|nr:hypothetical protein D4764_16G0003110 [Takifugu flavidus]
MRKSEIKTAEERQRRCGGRERRAEQQHREKSQLSVRGPIRWRGRAERGGKEWEYFGFWKKLEGNRSRPGLLSVLNHPDVAVL